MADKSKAVAKSRGKNATAPQPDLKPATPDKKTAVSAQRAAKILQFPPTEPGGGSRARMAAELQQTVGNARMGRMLAESSTNTATSPTDARSGASPESRESSGGKATPKVGSEPVTVGSESVAGEGARNDMADSGDTGGMGAGPGSAGASAGGSPPAPPAASADEPPDAALAQVSSLPPARLQQALGGVGSAARQAAAARRAGLAANPPRMQRPTGSPKNLHGASPKVAEPDVEPAPKVEPVAQGQETPTPEPPKLPKAPPPSASLDEPTVTGTEGGQLSQRDTAELSYSLGNLPTRDPGLQAQAGPAPRIELTGNADPARADEQRQNLQVAVADTQAQGRRDVAREMGENTRIFPSAPHETLTATMPGGEGAGGGGESTGIAMSGGAKDPEVLSIIAQQNQGDEIKAAVAQARSDMAVRREEYADKVSQEKTNSAKEVADLEARSTADQAEARAEARADVQAKKSEWSAEQELALREADREADDHVQKGREEVQRKKEEADRQAGEYIQKGDEEAERERRQAEEKAATEKSKGEKEGSGFFGWLASKAKAFFNKIRSAIKAAFDLARQAIKKAIDLARKAAMWAIEQARRAIVATIQAVGKALIAIGDRLLAAFPALRDKFRKLIQDRVDRAVRKVQQYAEQLKNNVNAALDLLAAGLDKLVGWLEQGYLAAINIVASVVDKAIQFADKVAQALGVFAVLIKDVASAPVRWLKNLGAAIVDGIRNHLWKAFREAIQNWFNSKLEQVLGLGQMVWDLIKSGGLALATVGKMAWEGLKSMIPVVLIRILIEKLVAMIVPAAGAVIAIIEGLQAAWGTVGRIFAAFQTFFAFLKSVKTGGAGPKFAAVLAAAAVAVIDFVANWLIAKLARGAAKVGGKIKGLAKKILGRKKGKKKGKKAKDKDRDQDKDKKTIEDESEPTVSRLKKETPKKSGKDKTRDQQKEKERKKQKQIERARRELPPKAKALLAKKPSRLRLKSQMAIWKVRYRLRSLSLQGDTPVTIVGVINPRIILGKGWSFRDAHLMRLVKEVAAELVTIRQHNPGRKAVAEEPESGLSENDLSGKTNLPSAMDDPGKLKLGDDASAVHRATPGSLAMGGSRSIVESGKEGGLSYNQIARRLKGAPAGPYLESLFKGPGGTAKDLTSEQKSTTEILFALFMKESTHPEGTGKHGRDLLYGAMLTQLATAKDPAHRLSVSEGIGIYPAGFARAQQGTRTVTNKLDQSKFQEFRTRKLGKKARERRRREAKMLERWGKMHLPEWSKIYPKKPDDEKVKELIRNSLMPLLERFRKE